MFKYMYDHVCMPNHANAFAQQQVSDMWHIQVSGAGAALAAMKDVEKVKDLEEKICKSVVTTKNMFFFKQSASHRIFGISNVNPHERLLLLEMQLQMCSIQVCCLKPSEQTVQIDMQTFQTCSATMIISLQGRDWIGLPPDENREHLHRPGTSNHFELAPYVCLRKGREFRRLRESWSENMKTHTAVQNIRRDSPRTGDNLQVRLVSMLHCCRRHGPLLHRSTCEWFVTSSDILRDQDPGRGSVLPCLFPDSSFFIIFHHVSSFLAHLMCMFDDFCIFLSSVVVEQLTGGDPRRGRAAPHEVNEAIFKG
jgi:hypothetical protein